MTDEQDPLKMIERAMRQNATAMVLVIISNALLIWSVLW